MPHSEPFGNPDVARTGMAFDQDRHRYFSGITFLGSVLA